MGIRAKTGILGASILAGSLLLGSEAYSQSCNICPKRDSSRSTSSVQQDSTKPNNIYSRNPEYSASGEGVLLKDFVYNLPDSTINLRDRFGLYAQRGSISYDAIDARKGLENTLSFLRSGVATPEKRGSINAIQRIYQSIPQADNVSLSRLDSAVADGVITQQEMNGIKPNTYMLIAKSPEMRGYESQSVGILVNVGSRQTTQERPAEVTISPRIDSTAINRARRFQRIREDSMRADSIRRARESVRESSIETREIPSLDSYSLLGPQFGFETELGLNDELTLGAFANLPLNDRLRAEAYGNFSVLRGDAYSSSADTTITQRVRELIGPGTYKDRLDEIIVSASEKGVLEYGLGLTASPTKNSRLELGLRLGVKRMMVEEVIDGRSNIIITRNQSDTLSNETIARSVPNDYLRNRFSISAGARFRLGNHLSVSASYNRTGKQNNWRFGGRFNFF